MLFCVHCGTQNPEAAAFCRKCGASIKKPENKTPAAPAADAPAKSPTAINQRESAVQRELNKRALRRAGMKQIGKSGVLLTAVIAFTISLLCSLFQATSDTSVLYGLTSFTGDSDLISRAQLRSFSDAMALWSIVGYIPSILIVIGMWVVIGKAYSNTDVNMTGSGLTVVKVGFIIQLVLIDLVLLVLVFVLIGLLFSAPEYFLVLSIPFGVIVLVVLYQKKVLQTIDFLRDCTDTGRTHGELSGFVSVWCYIFGSLAFFGLFAPGTTVTGYISILCDITAMICFGVFLGACKRQLREIMLPRSMPI